MLPDKAGVIEDIRGGCRRYGIQLIFKFGWSLCSVLFKVKDPLPVDKHSKVEYRIAYSASKTYIEESKRRLKTYLKEHRECLPERDAG